MLRRKFLLRIKNLKNTHQTAFYDIVSINFSILGLDKITLKNILKFFTALKLITHQQPMFLRLKKTQVRLNLKKGVPMGVFVSLKKIKKQNFLNFFKWEILPQINKSWLLKNKKFTNFLFLINNVFLFSNLKPFFFFFNNFFKIYVSLIFKKLNSKENFFILRYYQIPFEQRV